MVYIHDTIVVIYNDNKINKIRKKARRVFKKYKLGHLVSQVVRSRMNFTSSFFIAPDGSGEGWDLSNKGDQAREEFIQWLDEKNANNWGISYGSCQIIP